MAIAFRAAGTGFTASTSGTGLTFNKPAGAATGDLLVAASLVYGVTLDETVTLPANWIAVNESQVGVSQKVTVNIACYTVRAGDGATYTASCSNASDIRVANVVGYSGAADASLQFITPTTSVATTTGGSTTSATLTTLTNPDAGSWRITSFGCNANFNVTGTNVGSWASTDTSERVDTMIENAVPRAGNHAFYDSNGVITASTQAAITGTWTAGGNFANSINWMGFIIPAPAANMILPMAPNNSVRRSNWW